MCIDRKKRKITIIITLAVLTFIISIIALFLQRNSVTYGD